MKQLKNKILFDKKNIIIVIYTVIISIFLSLQISFNSLQLSNIKHINICLTILCLCFVSFISSHFIFKPKKIYNFLYNNRYMVALILFIIIVLGKFHCTSIGEWNDIIQTNYDYSSRVLISTPKSIRSDEWLVNTPIMLSQNLVKFSINNNLIRAIPTNIYLLSTATINDLIEIARPLSLGFFINSEYGLSIWWFGRLFCLFFTSFELLMILTEKNKKISLFGTLLISGSSVVQWFFASYITEILIGGQLALICLNQLLNEKNKLKKILWSVLMAIGFLDYCLILYPAHQIPFGYIYLVIMIHILFQNKGKIKNNIRYMILPLILIILILIRFFILCKDGIMAISSTVYPGNRFINGGNFSEWQRLLQYPYTLFLPFKQTGDACTISSFFSLFPLPIIISIYYLIKNKMKDKFILSLTLLVVVYLLFCIIPLPDIIVKYTLLSKTTVNAICAPIGLISIYLMCILWDKISFNGKGKNIISLILAIILSFICIYLSNNFMKEYLNTWINIMLILLFSTLFYLYIMKDNKIKENILLSIISIFMLVNIFYINPLTTGTDMIYKKPVSLKIKNIVSEDENGRWIALDSFITPNYLIMNGAKTINSTNLYPNLDIWRRIDKNKKYESIYNRYAHVIISLTETETKFTLLQPDLFKLDLNIEDIKKMDIDYIYSNNKIPRNLSENLEKIYDKDNSYIYKFIK